MIIRVRTTWRQNRMKGESPIAFDASFDESEFQDRCDQDKLAGEETKSSYDHNNQFMSAKS